MKYIATLLLMVPLLSLPKGVSMEQFSRSKTQYKAELVCTQYKKLHCSQYTYVITSKAY